ncbi:MAG TPA: DUF3592 domain-containing protein [Candidatus Acidoferrum sp.]
MSAPNASAPKPAYDASLTARVMPNRATTLLLLIVVRVFLAVALLGALTSGWEIFADLHARRTWPVADGEVIAAVQKDSNQEPLYRGSDPARYTRYWVEYQIRFAVPPDQCNTGTVSLADPPDPMPCQGIVRTRSTRSPAAVYDWLNHGYSQNSRIRVLHDPAGPRIKIVGESIWLIYRWDKIFILFGFLIFSLAAHTLVHRRMKYLETLPKDYDASPPATNAPAPDDLIDLKLS